MTSLLLGIGGLGYSSFMECNPRFLFSLFGATYRGVILNRNSLHPSSSWLSVLEIKDVSGDNFVSEINQEPELARATDARLVNIPVTDPSYGLVSLPYTSATSIEDEIRDVEGAVIKELNTHNVIASINAIDRIMSDGGGNMCELYSKVDSAVRALTTHADNFILFSPFGGIYRNGRYTREEHGIYMGTIDRTSEYDTLSPKDVGLLFEKLVAGD